MLQYKERNKTKLTIRVGVGDGGIARKNKVGNRRLAIKVGTGSIVHDLENRWKCRM